VVSLSKGQHSHDTLRDLALGGSSAVTPEPARVALLVARLPALSLIRAFHEWWWGMQGVWRMAFAKADLTLFSEF